MCTSRLLQAVTHVACTREFIWITMWDVPSSFKASGSICRFRFLKIRWFEYAQLAQTSLSFRMLASGTLYYMHSMLWSLEKTPVSILSWGAQTNDQWVCQSPDCNAIQRINSMSTSPIEYLLVVPWAPYSHEFWSHTDTHTCSWIYIRLCCCKGPGPHMESFLWVMARALG